MTKFSSVSNEAQVRVERGPGHGEPRLLGDVIFPHNCVSPRLRPKHYLLNLVSTFASSVQANAAYAERCKCYAALL
jgi:hypothetical protein